MKAIFKYTLIFLLGCVLLTACSEDLLETSPSTAVATNEMTESSSKAIAAIDGMYRFLYRTGYTSGWEHEEFGLSALNLAADLMGEDHLMAAAGSGWFWYDYLYGVKADEKMKSIHDVLPTEEELTRTSEIIPETFGSFGDNSYLCSQIAKRIHILLWKRKLSQ